MTELSLSALDFSPAQVKLGKSYLLLGTDSYLADRVLDTLRSTLKERDNAETIVVYGDEIKSAELNEHLDTFTVFASAKLVIIKNLEKWDKQMLDTLHEYFRGPSEIQSVALVVSKIDKRTSVWKQICTVALEINCEPPRYGGAIRAWLDKSLLKINKTMSSQAKDEFLNRIELDYYNAANELTKLDLLSGSSRIITENDVLKSLGTSRLGTLTDFHKALGRKQYKSSLEAMNKMLFAEWEPLQVLFQLNKFVMIVWKINLLRKAHLTDQEISLKHLNDVFQSQRKDFLDSARNYSLASLEKILGILLETDTQFKLSVADPSILLTNCLLQMLEA
jgi:DNA polymerase III delta subunit